MKRRWLDLKGLSYDLDYYYFTSDLTCVLQLSFCCPSFVCLWLAFLIGSNVLIPFLTLLFFSNLCYTFDWCNQLFMSWPFLLFSVKFHLSLTFFSWCRRRSLVNYFLALLGMKFFLWQTSFSSLEVEKKSQEEDERQDKPKDGTTNNNKTGDKEKNLTWHMFVF